MRSTHVRPAQVFEILQSLPADRKLVAIVRDLAREVERLDEEAAQLHASVMIYRDILRRHASGATKPALSRMRVVPAKRRGATVSRRSAPFLRKTERRTICN